MPTRPPVHRPPGLAERRIKIDQERQVTYAPYRQARWRKLRAQHLAGQPLCVHCLKKDVIKSAEEVDHIIPVRHSPEGMYDATNLQSLCVSCHSKKTARENPPMARR